VTKEKYLRAIVGDPPLVVGHSENVELETELAVTKQELREHKEEVRMMIEEMERMARDLARRAFRRTSLLLGTRVGLDADIAV
jgi:hypothetical protein